jgi:hypothetical protein
MTSKQATQATDTKPVMDLGADLSPAVAAIEKAYRMIQRRFADAPDATIVVKRDERAWGHTTVAKVWAPAAAEVADRFEIMISGENLRRGADAVAATLLHEAAHARNLAKGILDTDTNGRHNKLFKCTAEEHGLSCECDRWHGWTKTALTDEGRASWKALIATIERGLAKSAATAAPTIDHLPKPEAPKPVEGGVTITGGSGGFVSPPKRGNRNLLKAVCGCGHSIRVSAGVLAAAEPTCQICGEVFATV